MKTIEIPLNSKSVSRCFSPRKYFPIIFFVFSFTICNSQIANKKEKNHLFPIIENNKTGFIDSTGKVVIEPSFLIAGEFSEGLGLARVNGTYGYINENGIFVIPPRFDYATPFTAGLAIVYTDGKPSFINIKGETTFECKFPMVGQFKNGRAIVKTQSKKYGMIDKQGKLFIDTVYSEFNSFNDGLAIVQGINHHSYSDYEKGIKKNYEYGVIDTLGRFIIPYGKYEEIKDFENGLFKANLPPEPWDTIDGFTGRTVFFDKHGNILVSRDYKNNEFFAGNFHCGLAKMYLEYQSKGNSEESYKISYQGFLNMKGEMVINDTTFEAVEDFSENRAFIRNKELYSIIDTKGNFISKNSFHRIIGNGFTKGVAFVEVEGKWGLIDTNANFLIQPKFNGIDDAGMIDDYFFFTEMDTLKGEDYYLTGISKNDGSILVKPIMQDIDRTGYINGLLKCIINGKLTYINRTGEIIWQEKALNHLSNLNIDYMNRGYYYAHSAPDKKKRSFSLNTKKNLPQKIVEKTKKRSRDFRIRIEPAIKDTFWNIYNGFPVYIENSSKATVNFNAQDGRLYMKIQALNKNGEWQYIEYLPSSWCGNSYHIITLKPKYFWAMVAPVYEGDFKTKLRIELKYIDPSDTSKKRRNKNEKTIYSNEFEGSINPGQFWRKESYYPQSIMDPYLD